MLECLPNKHKLLLGSESLALQERGKDILPIIMRIQHRTQICPKPKHDLLTLSTTAVNVSYKARQVSVIIKSKLMKYFII